MSSEMLFHESYGVYYNAVSKIINLILEQKLDEHSMFEVIENTAFQETAYILEKKLVDKCFCGILYQEAYGELPKTEIRNTVKLPLSKIERDWLKTISLDPRIKLFEISFPDLDDAVPLYNLEDIVYCGRYYDGDDYNSDQYIKNFKTVFSSIKAHNYLELHYNSLSRGYCNEIVQPLYLQYSSREDRFRLIANNENELYTYNIARIEKCNSISEKFQFDEYSQEFERSYAEILVKNQRDTLERLLLFFSHLDKKTNRVDEQLFKVTLFFTKRDYKEVTAQLLSFYPMIEIVGPEYIKERYYEKIKKQKLLFNKHIL